MFYYFLLRYHVAAEDYTEAIPTTTFPSPTFVPTQPTTNQQQVVNTTAPAIQTTNGTNGSGGKLSKKGSIIFPSVKNKPTLINNTFASEAFVFKDVKVSDFT